MAVSSAVELELACPHCGRTRKQVMWRVIDVAERPDLAPLPGRDSTYLMRCGRCGTEWERPPLLVLHLSAPAPLLLGSPWELLETKNPLEAEEVLIETALSALPADDLAYPPVSAVPFVALRLAAVRDLETDLVDPEGTAAELAAHDLDLGRLFATFLAQLEHDRGLRRWSQAQAALSRATTPELLGRTLEKDPEQTEPEYKADKQSQPLFERSEEPEGK